MSGPAPSDDLMTDDEFERLLDTLHGADPTTGDPPAGAPDDALALEALELDDLDAVLPRLGEALDADGPIRIDLGRLERIDTAGLQLLLACRRAADENGRGFECLNPTATFIEAATGTGLVEALGVAVTGTRTDHA